MTPTHRMFPINAQTRLKIDEIDFQRVRDTTGWRVDKFGFIMRSIEMGNIKQKFSDLIMNIKPHSGFDVEFINGDLFDFRKTNLKIVVDNKRHERGSISNKPNLSLPSQIDNFKTNAVIERV